MGVIYLYGFTDPDSSPPSGGLLGVGDAEVDVVELEGVAAVVGRIDSPAFDGEALERNTADVEWMAEQGLRHEQVVAWFVDHARILPSRLLTLFSGLEALADEVAGESEAIRSRLDRFGGLDEWDLKVAYVPARLMARIGEVSEEVGRLEREIEAASPGKRFLLEKKRKDVARTEARNAAGRLARDLLDALRPLADDVARLDPPGEEVPVSLNAALLVARDRREEMRSTFDRKRGRLEELGLTAQLTGPWAPYRFLDRHE